MNQEAKWVCTESSNDNWNLPFDTPEEALAAQGIEPDENGEWSGYADMEDALAYCGIHECLQYKAGFSGKVRVEYEAELWAPDEGSANKAIEELFEMLPVGDMDQSEPPNKHDFDFWVAEQ